MKEREGGRGTTAGSTSRSASPRGWPYCCSGCPESQRCTDRKRYYDCVNANALPMRNRHAPRTYRGISEEDVARIDSAVSEGAAKGHPSTTYSSPTHR